MTNGRAFVILVMGVMLIVSGIGLCFYNYYVFLLNETNHTSLEVREIWMAYLFQAIISASLTRYVNHKIVLLCLIIGMVGAAEGFLLDYFEVMSFYDDWAHRGLKSRTFGCWFLNCQ